MTKKHIITCIGNQVHSENVRFGLIHIEFASLLVAMISCSNIEREHVSSFEKEKQPSDFFEIHIFNFGKYDLVEN